MSTLHGTLYAASPQVPDLLARSRGRARTTPAAAREPCQCHYSAKLLPLRIHPQGLPSPCMQEAGTASCTLLSLTPWLTACLALQA